MYILAALTVGFVAGVLFRDAYSMLRKALKEYKNDMADKPTSKRRRPVVWIIVIFFSLFQIALGIGVTVVVTDAAETQNCLVSVAESSTSTRDSAITWVEDFTGLIRNPEQDPEKARASFLKSSDTYVTELKDDNEKVQECVNKGGLW